MTKTITATEVVRKFSEILNSIKYTGDDYTVVRGGKPVASIRSAETRARSLTPGDLPALARSLPSLADEAGRFAKDLIENRKCQPPMPEKSKGHNPRYERAHSPRTQR